MLSRKEVEGQVLRASGVLQNGQHSSHGTTKIIGIEGHGDMNAVSVPGPAGIPISESRSFPENGDVRGGPTDYGTKTNGMDGGGGREGVKEEERQEAEEWEHRGAPEGHPAEE